MELNACIERRLAAAGSCHNLSLYIVSSPNEYKLPTPIIQNAHETSELGRLFILSQLTDDAKEVFIYSMLVSEITAHYNSSEKHPKKLIYVEKIDSTGFGSRPHHGSYARALVDGYLEYCLSAFQNYAITVSIFARAQPQYLFHDSSKNVEKHQLGDRKLIIWWMKAMNNVNGHSTYFWYIPGEELRTSSPILLAIPDRKEWTWGLPYNDSDIANDVIPKLVDDVKTKGLGLSNDSTTVKDFKELLSATGECGTGLSALLNMVVPRVSQDAPLPQVQYTDMKDTSVSDAYTFLLDHSFEGMDKALESTELVRNYLQSIRHLQRVQISAIQRNPTLAETQMEVPAKRPLQEAVVVNDLSSLVKKKKKKV
ncbi:histone acetylation protein-domain-containing protein [Chytridium lagenaria]|nr:histone acetylation protein-domain-containing protein [Chytridium lagenaria]